MFFYWFATSRSIITIDGLGRNYGDAAPLFHTYSMRYGYTGARERKLIFLFYSSYLFIYLLFNQMCQLVQNITKPRNGCNHWKVYFKAIAKLDQSITISEMSFFLLVAKWASGLFWSQRMSPSSEHTWVNHMQAALCPCWALVSKTTFCLGKRGPTPIFLKGLTHEAILMMPNNFP